MTVYPDPKTPRIGLDIPAKLCPRAIVKSPKSCALPVEENVINSIILSTLRGLSPPAEIPLVEFETAATPLLIALKLPKS